MSVKDILQSFSRGEQLEPPLVKWLYRQGYIEVADATNFDSTEKELIPTFITEKGKRLLEG
jgi:hypothetical protein